MIRVRSLEEAQSVARALCQRHSPLVSQAGAAASPRDVALKIFLAEMAAQHGGSAALTTLSPSPDRGAPQDAAGTYVSPVRQAELPVIIGGRSESSPSVASQKSSIAGAHNATGMETTGIGASSSSPPSSCAYCSEPTSRYCKETGRRHETSAQRAVRQWRTIYRQLQCTLQFIDSARLTKPNSCVEDFSVELDLND